MKAVDGEVMKLGQGVLANPESRSPSTDGSRQAKPAPAKGGIGSFPSISASMPGGPEQVKVDVPSGEARGGHPKPGGAQEIKVRQSNPKPSPLYGSD